MSARDVISSRDYAALSEAVRDALDRCAVGFDRYHADHAVDAVLDGLDYLGYAVVKLPAPEPSPDGDGVMFHGRGSAMVIAAFRWSAGNDPFEPSLPGRCVYRPDEDGAL